VGSAEAAGVGNIEALQPFFQRLKHPVGEVFCWTSWAKFKVENLRIKHMKAGTHWSCAVGAGEVWGNVLGIRRRQSNWSR